MLRETHQESLQDFHKAEAIRNAILQQVIKTIEPMYLKAFRNPITQSFTVPLHEIIQGLMAVYGKLNPKHFMAAKNALEAFQYDIKLPVYVIFDPIDDLSELAEVAGQPMTEPQNNNIAFIIFQNMGKFKSDLKIGYVNRLLIRRGTI